MILQIIKEDNSSKDISSMVGNISLSSSLDTLGDQLDFEIAYSDTYYYPKFEVNAGDRVILQDADKQEVFRGIIVEKTRNEKAQSFSCFDYAFYLNKSKTIQQFNSIRADNAIKMLLNYFRIPIGGIANMPTIIKKVYFDQEVSEILKDIIQQVTDTTRAKYVMEMDKGKFYIRQDTESPLNLKIKVADNLPPVDISKTISNPSKKASMEELKNSIRVYVGNEDKVRFSDQVTDPDSIVRYGVLEETRSLEDKDIAQAKNIAKNLLKELNKMPVEGSIEVLGHFDLRAGRTIQLNEPITNLVGKYKIKSANHSIGTIHTTSLELEGV
ncbi:XkdQ/YqbQ family protein [Clostridium aminobutyricum]|uniref:YqbQ/XkdQ domain-containing protein n=1 Tax=Clostridium aminobutyricum TaxID=33953 RepID=A0A939D8R4_CLOAM|nr:hypothetical protein [Clostridium aminobutyricum]MBN7773165.1 hypothetical protein [Clostridium aminobutyricum]